MIMLLMTVMSLERVFTPNERAVTRAKATFEKKINTRLAPKIARNKELNKDITKVYFNGGKKRKNFVLLISSGH